MNKYYKNFILCGDIDQYCLLCKESFHLIPDIEKHIRWEKHRKNIKDLTYLPKFRNDFIYKIGNSYYCERCNLLMNKIASVKEHVKSERHKLFKTNPDAEIKKPAGLCTSGYVIINKVILNKGQWNSIVDNKCLICNIDVANVDEHIALETHIISLIQSETKYADNQYYRKINEETYHCFACKNIFTTINFASHWLSCENKDDIDIKKLKETKTSKYMGILSEDISRMAELEKKLVETLQEFYSIDETTNEATCRYCHNFIAISFKSMIEHMKYQHDKQTNFRMSSSESSEEEVVYREVADNGQKRAELAKYGREKFIKLNHNGGKGYCTLCDRYMSACKKVFREHCKGVVHRGHSERLGVKNPKVRDLPLYLMQNTVKFISGVHYSPELRSIFVNGAFSLDVDSFFLFLNIKKTPQLTKTKCHVCNEVFKQENKRDHCLTTKHMDSFTAAKVVLKPGEFIRELRQNLFHCGFCNITISFSDILERHIQSHKHIMLQAANTMVTNRMNLISFSDPTVVELSNGDGDLYLKLLNQVCTSSSSA